MRFVVLLLFTFVHIGILAGEGSLPDTRRVLEKLCSKNVVEINNFLSLQEKKTGKFLDIDYEDQSYTYWQPSNHLERVKLYTEAYIDKKNSHYQSDIVYKKIIEGIEFWIQIKPHSENWWYNQIKVPMQLGQILVNMRFGKKHLNKALVDSCISIMSTCVKDPYVYVGTNRTDIATHYIYRACLTDDDSLMQNAVKLLYSTICYGTGEGLVVDNSFCQHGRQFYLGAYGRSFLSEVSKWAYLLKDTKFALPIEKLRILSNFARRTFFPSIRGDNFTYNACGRSISRKEGTNVGASPYQIAKYLTEVDNSHKEEYEYILASMSNAKNRKFLPKTTIHNHFFFSDYTLHSCPAYTVDVRMSSKRTVKCESINEENTKNFFLSDGGTCLMVDGSEFSGIFPVWNWSRIPGVTAPHTFEVPTVKGFTTHGTTVFAGGVSDSIHGASAMICQDNLFKLKAKKSWFFFDNEVICLGSDISSKTNMPIETTVNQCIGKGDCCIAYKAEGGYSIISNCEEKVLKSPKWIFHNKIGYIFPNKSDVIISKTKQRGSWSDINKAYGVKSEMRDVFYLGIAHGTRVKRGAYAYILVPNLEDENKLIDYLRIPKHIILKHNQKQHSVYDSHADILQIVFFEEGKFSYNRMHIQVSMPCIMMIKGVYTDKDPTLHFSNVTQSKMPINVSLSYKGKKKELTFNTLYNEPFAGATECRRIW